MDAFRQYKQTLEIPQNLSFKSINYSFADKSFKTVVGNEYYDHSSKFPIYCMSDTSGHLHFNLSVFPDSTLNPTEQQNLGKQLPEYIKDHYDKFQTNQNKNIILEECNQFNPHLQEIYNDFVMHNPTFNLSYETYTQAHRNLSPYQIKSLSRSSVSFVQNNFPDHCFSEKGSLLMPSDLYGPVENSSTSSVPYSNCRVPICDQREQVDRNAESPKVIDKEAIFFNQLNICRKKELLHSIEDNLSKNLSLDNLSHIHQPTIPPFFKLSSERLGTGDVAPNNHPSPLPSRCSCPSRKCLRLFQEQERQKICKQFWCGKTYKKKDFKWFGASVQQHFLWNPKFPPKDGLGFLFIGKYFLHKADCGRQKVCRHFFLTTLGLYFLFPILDVLKRKVQRIFEKKNETSLQSKLCKNKSKRLQSVKHHMKRHVRSYFFRHYYLEKMAASSITSSARKSFVHFSFQFPHLVDGKSWDKYAAIVHKIVNSLKLQPLQSLPNRTSHVPHQNEKKQSSLSVTSPSCLCDASGRIMKIKPEDIDEVLADDFAKKTSNSREVMRESNSYSGGEKQSVSVYSDASTISTNSNMAENFRRQPLLLKKNVTNLLESSIYHEVSEHHKKSETSKRKRKGNTKQKKRRKVRSESFKNASGGSNRIVSPDHSKTYKLAVNEIEGDQWKHPILPPCNCIKSKCSSKVPEEQRKAIHSNFWNLDNISRRGWMVKHVHIMKPKSRSNRATARLHQMHRKFFLPDCNGELHDVCKKFFLGTLGFKGTGVLRPQSIPGFKNTLPGKEPRKRVLSYQVSQQDVMSVIEYCKSFNKEESVGFCGDEKFTRSNRNVDLSDSHQQRICVPYGFTWKELYRDYCTKNCHVEFGYQTFRSILSIIEHNSFSVDILEKFQTAVSSNCTDTSVDFDPTTISDLPSPSIQEQYHLLQSFPKIPKIVKKPASGKEPREDLTLETETKITKSRKKLRSSKPYVEPDYNLTFRCLKPRSTSNSRYNFRSGVPLVSYSFDSDIDQNNDEFSSNDFHDNLDSEDIKAEASSDQESKIKKPVKAKSKKVGRPSKKMKSKKRQDPVDESFSKESSSIHSPFGKKRRGRKKIWHLKIDMKQQESTIRLKGRHPILPPCKCNYRKCHEKVSQEQREIIHNLYWSISSKQERIRWVLEHIRRCSPKSRSNTNLPSRKRETRRYFLPKENNETIEVCRVFFLRTLGYHWDSVVDSVSRTLPRPDGYLAKSLGFSEEQLPYEVIVQIKMFLKSKKIRKSSISADQFPDGYFTGENNKDKDVTLEGYAMRALFHEFQGLHPEHTLDFRGFKQIVRFILIPGSEAQTEWEIKQEHLLNTQTENIGLGCEGECQESALSDNTVYFTPEFEKIDLEKALVRKARRRRPLSSRNSKEQHPMREPCKCARNCREKIDQSRRERIHEFYWSLITYNQRKQWILEHIKREAPKRRTNPNGPIKKMETRKFYFEDCAGKKVEICKGFFLSTLGFKWDKMVDTICKTTPRDGRYVRPDQRGKKPPSHKLSEELITSVTNYIETILETATCVYPKMPGKSHTGKQKKTPDRMPYGLTMKNLFEDYKAKHINHKVGYESFRKIYRSIIHSEKYQPSASSSSQVQDEDEEPDRDQIHRQHQQMTNMHIVTASIDSSSADAADEHEIPSFESIQPSCMFKNQAGMRLLTQDQAHLPTYPRQCEPPPMKTFPESINSFTKSHDVHFYQQSLEQNEEMSMQMYKSICLPASNPNQPYAFYPNSLPLDAYSMNSGPQSIHSGLPYSDTLRHSDLMHHHAYQPPHPHFSQGRFHGFVLPGSSSKEPELSHHPHSEMNVVHNYREDFNCNPYSGKNPLVYPPSYHNTDTLPSSSAQRHSFNSIPVQNPGIHGIRNRDANSSAPSTSLLDKNYVPDTLTPNCHVPNSVAVSTNQSLSDNDWASQFSPSNQLPEAGSEQREKIMKKPKGRPKKPVKEKTSKVKKVKKIRPKSKRNTREFNPMLPPCKCTIKKCLEKIPEKRRKEIYELFWDLGCYNTRKQWIAENIVREDPKRRTSLDNPLRRMETRRFFLPNENGEKMEVCKGFFLRTLGFKWDKMVDTICKTTEKGQTIVRPDMRGRRGPSHKLKDEVASSIDSYVRSILLAAKPAYEAHVTQSGVDDDKDIFVPYGLTVKNFHEDYKGKHAHHKVGYESFRKIFRRVSKEVLGNVPLQEEDKVDSLPMSTHDSSDVISPETGLLQQAP